MTWTDELVMRALLLRKAGKKYSEIDRELGLQNRTTIHKIGADYGRPPIDEQIEIYTRRLAGEKIPITKRWRVGKSSEQIFGASIPDEVLRDRDARLSAPWPSQTAEFCGDPKPGQSALDKSRP